ncbi:hypothetical protein GIB67_024403 [Kingdonia uniflora]|uniref:Uncharacterized protein n=1 Tax=Kingdonia uniflora TaxID=39325 RepID=A0A7J7LDK0_9MAGN|nr:hypothetical protein GIB67_024403 [Kingdonia uniflora]
MLYHIIIAYHYSLSLFLSLNSYLYSSVLILYYLDHSHLVYYSFTLKLSLSHSPHPLLCTCYISRLFSSVGYL